MYKKFYFLISVVLVLSLAPISYGQGPIYLDLEPSGSVAEPGFTSFHITDSGMTINDITVEISGTIDSRRRNNPTGVPYEQIYRDFIFGTSTNAVTITLWGLGDGRECEITIYSFDDSSTGNRIADWKANDANLFTTSFSGGVANWPNDINDYRFTGTGFADGLGRIILKSSQNPSSVPGQPFAFVNALLVIPKGEYLPIKYASGPQPVNGQQDVPVYAVIRWKAGRTAAKHDVYLGTDKTSVQNADRGNPLGVLVGQDWDANTFDPSGLLKLNTTYYWRIDEVNDAPDYTIFKGEVWNFRTTAYCVMENFNSYATDDDLRDVWKDSSTNGTRAFVSLESGIVSNGNSMMYEYRNNIPPHYSQACADIADLEVDDPNWLGTGAQALVLYFRGEPNNPIGEPMYVTLTDGDSSPHTAVVTYHSMADLKVPQWQKWNIPLTEFNDVNLANVAGITIGFGNGSGSGEGTVYFEDILLDTKAEGTAEAAGDVNLSDVHQRLDGFGGAAVYDCPALTTHPMKEEIYDLLFKDLGLEFLRIRNTYGYSADPLGVELAATAEILAEAREPNRSPNIKTELVPWSPAAYLKSNGSESGGGTLKKVGGNFVYADYAQWWYDSLLAWEANGVKIDVISLQNEPDIATSYDSCRFTATQTTNYAGYDQAFEAVYNKLNAEMGPNMPKMWAPCTMGLYNTIAYIDALISRGQLDNVAGISHHLYTDGNYDDPDGMIGWFDFYAANLTRNKPLHMTEYVKLNTTPNFDMGLKFAWHIYNCLYHLRSTSYFNWTLFRGLGPTSGGIVTMTSPTDYVIRPQYWFLKAYTRFTDKDWSVLGTSVAGPDANNLRMSAFTSPDDSQLTIVILNKSTDRTVITLPNFTPTNSAVYRSGQTLTWAYLGSFTPTMSLPPESITTIWMDRRPTANAGPDQMAYAWIDGLAEVTLDGSDSNDLLGNELTYSWTWTIDGNTYEANGVSPTIELPVGKHTIELVVNDGLLDSEPDYVDVNVIAPLKAHLCITPRAVNRKSHLPNIMASIELPKGIKKSDIKDEPFILYPPSGDGLEAVWQRIYGCSMWGYSCRCWPWWCHRVKAFALFNTDELMAAVPGDGMVKLQVVGRLNSGRYFVGSDSICIFTPPPPRPKPHPWPPHRGH